MSTGLSNYELVESIRRVAATELRSTVDRAVGAGDQAREKVVLLDSALLDPLRFTHMSTQAFSQEAGVVHVDVVSEYSADDSVREDLAFSTLICFVRPSLRLMEPLARRIKAYERQRQGRMRTLVYFVPKRTVMCHHVLRENGIVDDGSARGEMGCVAADIEDLEIDLFPLDNDLLSMELPCVYRDLFLDGDLSILKIIARTVVKLQSAFVGPIPNVHGKGAMARKVLEMMKRMKSDLDAEYLQEIPSTIDTLIVVDRGVDLLTPFMSQLTYEGIVDEEYDISATSMRIDNGPSLRLTVPRPIRIPNREPRPQFEGYILLDSHDDVFCRIRDYIINNVGVELHRWSQEIKANYDRRKNFTSGATGANALAELKEMREIVQNLPKWQETQRLIGIHVDITTELNRMTQHARFRKQIQVERHIILGSEDKMCHEYVEELIDRVEPLPKVLRLLCMMSLCNSGIKQKALDGYRQSMMHAYGFPQIMTTLYNFERAGLIVKQIGAISQTISFFGRSSDSNTAGGGADSGAHHSASSVPFSRLRTQCRLMPDGSVDARPPTTPQLGDVGYYYKHYAPLLCRIVEDLVTAPESSSGAASTAPGVRFSDHADSQFAPTGQRKILVVVIGGATSAEIACLRNAIGGDGAAQAMADGDMTETQRNSSVLIATTSIINGNQLCKTMLPFDASA